MFSVSPLLDMKSPNVPAIVVRNEINENAANILCACDFDPQGKMPVGSGPWDSQGRESFLSPERVLRVTGDGMRRESMGMDRAHYDRAVQAVKRWHGLG